MQTRITLNAVNYALAQAGHAERLAKGNGYFYFRQGNAADWPTSMVLTTRLNDLTLAQWIEERNMLAKGR